MALRILSFYTVFLLFIQPTLADDSQLPYAKRPEWVRVNEVNKPASVPLEKIKNGLYYLLVDEQIIAEKQKKTSTYSHYGLLVVSQAGLQDAARIDISYDPSYQTLSIHSIMVIRDGKAINKIDQVKYSLLQRETDLENLIYNGSKTANILIEDLRVNDIVTYEYSIEGSNPVYDGKFSHTFYTQWSIPLKAFYFRLVWGKDNPIYFNEINTSLKPKKITDNGKSEYIYSANDVEPVLKNSQSPVWFDPYGRVQASEYNHWEDVVSWALPLYDPVMQVDDELNKIVVDINKKYSTAEEKIAAALRLVQSEVRYLGIENGVNSHKPSPAAETWRRRYGDCKDKVVLLVTLLKQMNFDAYPALVNTSRRKTIEQLLPSASSFDHVITKVTVNDVTYWLDPTRQYQYGPLSDLYQSNFGFALIVKSGEKQLTAMHPKSKAIQKINETIDFSKGLTDPIDYSVTTQFIGGEAERKRYDMESMNFDNMTRNNLNFYKGYYSDIEESTPLKITDTKDNAEVLTTENYAIHNPLEKNDNNKSYFTIYANLISSQILKPDVVLRTSPLAIKYPEEIDQTIEVLLKSKGLSFELDPVEENNPFFTYSFDGSYDKSANKLKLHYRYTSKVDSIPADKIADYLSARKRVMDDAEYRLNEVAVSGKDVTDDTNLTTHDYYVIFGAIYAIAFLFMYLNWKRDSQQKAWTTSSVFYPASLSKVALLTFFTLGIYTTYWFWKNWQYIKRKDSSHIMPLARAVFSPIWLFALYKRLACGEEAQNRRVLPASSLVAALFAAVYLLATVLYSRDEVILVLIGNGLATLIVLTMAYQVQQLNQPTLKDFENYRHWKMRHFVLIVCCSPIMFFPIAQNTRLIPTDEVIHGNALWRHDINFMRSKGILAKDESIDYFYSTAAFSYRNDGNGLTKESVFSYWLEDGKLNYRTAHFNEIEEITHTRDQKNDYDVVRITLADDSYFLLYLPTNPKAAGDFYKQLELRWKNEKYADEFKLAFSPDSDPLGAKKKQLKDLFKQIIDTAYDTNTAGSGSDTLAQLYEKGILVPQNSAKAIHYFERALKHDNERVKADLAWLLATIENDKLRDPERSLSLIQDVLNSEKTARNREILAAAYAANNDYEKSVEEQALAIKLMKSNVTEAAKERLAKYQEKKPWIEKWIPDEHPTSNVFTAKAVKPDYPEEARKKGIEGTITVTFDVHDTGEVANIRFLESDLPPEFANSTVNALHKSIFIPAIENGTPILTKDVKRRFRFNFEK